jgi:hypothetical protein
LLAAVFTAGCHKDGSASAPEPRGSFGATILARPDRDLILDAVFRDVLGNEFLKEVRAGCGTPGDRRVVLVSNAEYGVPWPHDYRPLLPEGYEVRRVAEGANTGAAEPRMLGIRIDRLNLQQKEAGMFAEPIAVTLMNPGGEQNGAIIGGCSVSYFLSRKQGHWTAECTRLSHP